MRGQLTPQRRLRSWPCRAGSRGRLRGLIPATVDLSFMTYGSFAYGGNAKLMIARSGYTGEDGFEILAPAAEAVPFWNKLPADSA